MQRTIISDASCIILLEKIGELSLLKKLFGKIITTKQIAKEFGKPLPNWFELKEPKEKNYRKILEASVDKGEASAIALALEYDDCLLIMDDLKGRKLARELGLHLTGTLGIIVDAKLSGHIRSVKPILKKIKATNFWITGALEEYVLSKAKE